MITINKYSDKCLIYYDNELLGKIMIYDNPQHTTNAYAKIEFNSLRTDISEELFIKLRMLVLRPLQVMVYSDNIDLINFLVAGGFICKRKCYEIEAIVNDYIGKNFDKQIFECSVGDKYYEECCNMMFNHYVVAHKAVNPWTADYKTFCSKLTNTAMFSKCSGKVMSVAFVENNEIAYVCTSSNEDFYVFAQSLISIMFKEYSSIFFECDDCDYEAMILKNLFIHQDDRAFCTYILE